jgi:hypothetical protein
MYEFASNLVAMPSMRQAAGAGELGGGADKWTLRFTRLHLFGKSASVLPCTASACSTNAGSNFINK